MSPNSIASAPQRAGLLTALYDAERQHGYLSDEAFHQVSEQFSIPLVEVYSTASFYKLYNTKPTGKYILQVCEGLSCFLAGGAERLADYLRNKLSIEIGETTADGLFTLETMPCLASCGTSPAMRVNGQLYDNLTMEKIDALVEKLGGE